MSNVEFSTSNFEGWVFDIEHSILEIFETV